jgi:hypothetical protein
MHFWKLISYLGYCKWVRAVRIKTRVSRFLRKKVLTLTEIRLQICYAFLLKLFKLR